MVRGKVKNGCSLGEKREKLEIFFVTYVKTKVLEENVGCNIHRNSRKIGSYIGVHMLT